MADRNNSLLIDFDRREPVVLKQLPPSYHQLYRLTNALVLADARMSLITTFTVGNKSESFLGYAR